MSKTTPRIQPSTEGDKSHLALAATNELPKVAGPTLPANGGWRLAGTLLRRRVSMLFRHFPAALTGDEEGIHQLRVSGRRLRVALPLLVKKPGGRRATRARHLLQRLTQAAGSSRDLDVLLASYDQRLNALPARTTEQKLLRHRLTSARRRGRKRLVDSLLDLEISRLRSDLTVLVARGGATAALVCERFGVLGERDGHSLHTGFITLGGRLDAEALHFLRRRARRLRYAVEVFEQIRASESAAAKPWKKLQDLIGEIHDHHVLAEWFDKQAHADEERGNVGLAATARMEAAWARDKMHQLHQEFLAADPVAIVTSGLFALGFAPSAQST